MVFDKTFYTVNEKKVHIARQYFTKFLLYFMFYRNNSNILRKFRDIEIDRRIL